MKGISEMANRDEFANALHELIAKYAADGLDPLDLANELQDQVNVFIGQHNLEYELSRLER